MLASVALSWVAMAAPAHAKGAIDCPLRDRPYSVDSPLLDILIKPQARRALESSMPGLLTTIPAFLTSTKTPTFAAILTPRTLFRMGRLPDGPLVPLGRTLAAIPVTQADKAARCARYDGERPAFTTPVGKVRLLVFEKMTGFRDGPSVDAAGAALRAMAAQNGWSLVFTDKGGAMTPQILKHFDAVIWNNVSGDVLTLPQRRAFKHYVQRGGGFVGLHGSGGDPVYFWDWYVDTLIGARFIGHPMAPQFQDATVIIDDPKAGIALGLPPKWTLKDEWYSFAVSPRLAGAHVIARLDETSYTPVGRLGDIRMGDHPIAWTRCVGNGRSFYSAIGHLPQSYSEPHHFRLLGQAILWAAGQGDSRCVSGRGIRSARSAVDRHRRRHL